MQAEWATQAEAAHLQQCVSDDHARGCVASVPLAVPGSGVLGLQADTIYELGIGVSM